MSKKIEELLVKSNAFIICPEHAKIGEVSEVSFDSMTDLEEFIDLVLDDCAEFLSHLLYDDESILKQKLREHFHG